MHGNFFLLLLSSADIFSKLTFSKKLFQEPYSNFKQFGSRSGQTFCRPGSGHGLILFAKTGDKKSPLARKELNVLLEEGAYQGSVSIVKVPCCCTLS